MIKIIFKKDYDLILKTIDSLVDAVTILNNRMNTHSKNIEHIYIRIMEMSGHGNFGSMDEIIEYLKRIDGEKEKLN